MRTLRALMVVLISVVSLATLSVPPDSRAAASPSQDALHEVLPGDDLRLIAAYYYGDARQWERIWNANRDQLRNPNRVERGTLLRIPGAASPAESYPDFVARVHRPLPPQAALTAPAVSPIPPPAEARLPGGPSSLPEPSAIPTPARVIPPAPSKAQAPAAGPAAAPAPGPAATGTPSQKTSAAPVTPGVTALAPTSARTPTPTPVTPVAPAPPQKAATPAAPPAPQPVKSPEPQTAPARPALPPVRPATPPSPPPPKTWYEDWGLDELFASPLFLGGVTVVVIGLAVILLIRRRRSAVSEVEEVPE